MKKLFLLSMFLVFFVSNIYAEDKTIRVVLEYTGDEANIEWFASQVGYKEYIKNSLYDNRVSIVNTDFDSSNPESPQYVPNPNYNPNEYVLNTQSKLDYATEYVTLRVDNYVKNIISTPIANYVKKRGEISAQQAAEVEKNKVVIIVEE